MSEKDTSILNEALADAVMDRPREFFIGDRRYCLWSPSLGVSLMLGRHLRSICMDTEMMSENPSLEALRLVREKRDDVCYILAILSFRSFTELSNSTTLKRRADIYSKGLTDEELAQLAMVGLNTVDAGQLIKMSGLDREHKEQSRISEYKNKDGHTKVYGGRTMYGTLIDAACRAYGWSKEYTVWGIDLTSLRMMLADKVDSVYLSDEDIKALGIVTSSSDEVGMSRDDIEKLKKLTDNNEII